MVCTLQAAWEAFEPPRSSLGIHQLFSKPLEYSRYCYVDSKMQLEIYMSQGDINLQVDIQHRVEILAIV